MVTGSDAKPLTIAGVAAMGMPVVSVMGLLLRI